MPEPVRPGRRLQRRRHRRMRRHLLAALVAQRRAAAARDPRRLPPPARAGLDRRDPHAASGPADLHVLGLLPQPLRARCRPAHRSPAAQRAGRDAARAGRRRPRGARPRKAERPRPGVGGARLKRRRRRAIDTRRFKISLLRPVVVRVVRRRALALELSVRPGTEFAHPVGAAMAEFLVATTARLVSVLIVFFSSASGGSRPIGGGVRSGRAWP